MKRLCASWGPCMPIWHPLRTLHSMEQNNLMLHNFFFRHGKHLFDSWWHSWYLQNRQNRFPILLFFSKYFNSIQNFFKIVITAIGGRNKHSLENWIDVAYSGTPAKPILISSFFCHTFLWKETYVGLTNFFLHCMYCSSSNMFLDHWRFHYGVVVAHW